MKPNIFKSAVLLLVLCMIANVQASVVFSDNFENVTAVQWPNPNVDADPLAQVGTWSATEFSDRDIQVSNNVVPGASTGSNFLTVNRSTSNSIELYGKFSEPLVGSDLIKLDFDFYVSSAAPNGQESGWGLRDLSDGLPLNVFAYFVYSSAYGGFRVANGSGSYLTPYSEGFAPDQWHHVTYTVNLVTDTFDITVSGITYANIPFLTPASKLTHLWLSSWYGGSYYFMDNVVVSGTTSAPLPGPAMAGKVFVDDFENVTAVSWPDLNNNADPDAQIGAWGELTAIDNTGTFLPEAIQVTDNAVPGPATGDSSGYLVFDREAYSFMVASWAQELDASDEPIIIEFDFYLPYTSEGYQGLNIGIQESTTFSTIDPAILNTYMNNVYFGGVRVMNSGTTYLTPAGSWFNSSQWHHARYDLYLSTDTYDLRIDNTIYEDLAFDKSVDSVGHMFIGGYGAGSLFYLDNISVGTQNSVCLSSLRADITDDCKVDVDDLVILLDAWLVSNNY